MQKTTLIKLDPSTGTAAWIGEISPDENMDLAKLTETYKWLALGMIPELQGKLHLAYAPALETREGFSNRYMTVGKSKRAVARAILGETTQINNDDVFVIFGPSAMTWRDEEYHLSEIVADDLSAALLIQNPIAAQGPVKGAIPYLFQIAGSILLIANGGSEVISEDTADRVVGRSINAMAYTNYGGFNAIGQLMTENPQVIKMFSTAAKKSREISSHIDKITTIKQIINLIHNVIRVTLNEFDEIEINTIPPG